MDKVDKENIEGIQKRFTKSQLAEIVYRELQEGTIWGWRDEFKRAKKNPLN